MDAMMHASLLAAVAGTVSSGADEGSFYKYRYSTPYAEMVLHEDGHDAYYELLTGHHVREQDDSARKLKKQEARTKYLLGSCGCGKIRKGYYYVCYVLKEAYSGSP